jgi:hypothetical protein
VTRGYLSETGNNNDIEAALSKPGTVFWQPLNSYGATRAIWHELKPKGV